MTDPAPSLLSPRADAFFRALCIRVADEATDQGGVDFAAVALRGFEYREHVAQHHPDLTSLCRELGEAKVVDAAARKAWRFGYDFEGP